MIVIAPWVPYLATQGIGMRQFMEVQAVFALVIVCGELPSGLLSDLWGRKKMLLLGSTLKAVSFSLLPLWSSYGGFLFYHLTMRIALSMISGGDVALLYDSHLAAGGLIRDPLAHIRAQNEYRRLPDELGEQASILGRDSLALGHLDIARQVSCYFNNVRRIRRAAVSYHALGRASIARLYPIDFANERRT